MSGRNVLLALGLLLSGFLVRPLSLLATRFGRDGRGTNAITKFRQCLSQEPSQPKPLGRHLGLCQGSCYLEGIDRGGSNTCITVSSTPDCRRLAIMVLTWFKPP